MGTAFSFESTNDIRYKKASSKFNNYFHFQINFFFRSPTNFDISSRLNIPILEIAPQIDFKISLSQGTVSGQSVALSGSLAIKNNEVFILKFVRTTEGESDLSVVTPIPQVSDF